ncbi:multiple C2 and transmembrane domain-containing protein isoform X2 [Eurytemora carolleeae]|nr:multiple C2 and transmembrane domain-containing protein isoform X2 [Eurytemora carolleeae]XP_023330905.1 multiple C2 and transmembrane domain-containing protein isoform X2 [Eurytemora carolleeae]|eukprot:XP_023330904.1 multiple C2 and transmembrane domain-containing protein-like isoform X2 [Eurytemora affinis]
MSLLSRNKGGSLDDPRPNSPALMREDTHSLPDTTFHSIEDIQEYSKYHLLIHLRQGQDLPAKDSCGTSDPYIKFLLASKMVYKSKTIYKDLNPFWDENFYITIEDLNLPLELKVYDYDWGLRDDFIGQAFISLKTLILNQPQDIVVTLHETGNIKYLGQISLNVKLIPLLPDTPLPPLPLHPPSSTSHHSSFSHSPARGLELAARRLKPGTWSAIVNILLVEGKDLLAMDIEGTSDPYCKFRLGSDRFKTKTIYASLNPKWNEEFDLYLYDESELEITVWDKDQRSKDDFMGRGCIDLSTLSREDSHHLWIQLEEGSGQIFIILTISGTTGRDNPTFLSNWDNTNSINLYREKYALKQSLTNIDDVGVLIVKVFGARGLHAADLGGSSDPYCVLELDNTRVLTHTEYKTLEPSWQKVFVLSVQDVHSVLNITVFDEDKNHKSEFLGRLVVPLIKIKNQNKRWFALKDKKLRCRAKGQCPQIQMEFILHWNIIRATYTTLNPKKTLYKETVEKFKRQVFINNVMRIKAVILEIVDFGVFIQSCLEWESTSRSIIAFITFMTISYYFEPYMVPVGLLLIFLKQYIFKVYLDPKHLEREEQYLSEDDDEMDEKDEDKEEKKSLKEKLQAIQDVTAMVQNALGYVASLAEGVKNTFNFSVPFLSWLAVIIFSIIAVVLYFIPLRVLIMVWGVNKFGKKLVRPDTVTNNELMDFLSRVPSDEDLLDARELRLLPDTQETGKKSTVKKKHKQS